MRSIQELDKALLQSEFEKSRMLYEHLRAQGYAPLKASAIIYRHGYLDGRDSQKAPLDAAYKELRAFRAAADAQNSPTSGENEGSTDNE